MAQMNDVNLNGVEASMDAGGPVIPNGKYRAVITHSERKKTSDQQSELLALKFTIQGGEYSGQSVTARLNLWNKSQQACNIAKAEYKYILDAMRIQPPQDTQALHNLPLDITIVVEDYKKKNSNEMGKTNRITDYAPVGAVNTQNQQPQQQSQQPTQDQTGNAAPSTPPYAQQ